MNIETEPHHLVGLVDPVGKGVGFLIPVFARKGSNALRVERIDSKKRVEAFVELEPQVIPVIDAEKRDSHIGAPHHWAFGFGLGDIIVGQGEEGQDALRGRLKDPFFSERPLLALEVAEFLQLRAERLHLAGIARQWLKQIGSKAAERWCDLSVLTPDVRTAVSRVVSIQSPNDADSDIERLTVRVQGEFVQVLGLDQNRHPEIVDQIIDAIRETLSELHTLYVKPASGWKIQFIGSQLPTTERAPRGYDLDALSALVYIADGDAKNLRRVFSKYIEEDIGLYPPRQRQEFLRQSAQFRGPSFVLFQLDSQLGPILPELRSRKLLPIGLATRTSAASRLLPAEKAAFERYPHPTAVVNVRDSALLPRGAGLLSEVRDAVHILGSASRSGLFRRLPTRTNYFLRARGLGLNRIDDAWAQIYGRCVQLGLTEPTGLRFEVERRFADVKGYSRPLSDILFPEPRLATAILDRDVDSRSLVDAAVLVEADESFEEKSSRRKWKSYSRSVKHVLEHQGWSISGSLDPMDAAIVVGRRRFDLSANMERRKRRSLYPFEALLDQDLNEIRRITVTENATLGAILTSLMEERELLATVRDLSAFPAEDGTIWTLFASQMRRFINSLPTRTRSYYFATLCQDAVQRDRIELEDAERLVQAWHHPSFGEQIHMICTGVRYELKQAAATLRLVPPLQHFGRPRPLPGFRGRLEALRFELTITRDGSAIGPAQRVGTRGAASDR